MKSSGVVKDMELLFGPKYEVYPRNVCYFVRAKLRITAGDNNEGIWRMAKCPPYHLATLSIRAFRDTAGIDETDVSPIINANHFIPLRPKLPRNRGSFGEVQLASKGMESDSLHRYEKELPERCGQLFPFFILLLRIRWFVCAMF